MNQNSKPSEYELKVNKK